MNYLAHLYLSGEDEEIRIGNFMGDYVKGKEYEKYPEMVRKGILLHRGIDDFTDKHPIVRSIKAIFQEKYHKYSGIIVDILFDHLLYINWKEYSSKSMNSFVSEIHQLLKKKFDVLPVEVQRFVPSFIEKDWISAYQTLEGIELVLSRMSLRTSLPDRTRSALKRIRANYVRFNNDFNDYFPLLIRFVEKEFGIVVCKS